MSLNVLITAASRRVALVQGFRRALADRRGTGAVVVSDVNPLSPAIHVADRAYRGPLSCDPGYLDAVAHLCRCERIGLIVPTIDDELPLFAAGETRFARLGIRVAVSPEPTVQICNDKYLTCRHLRQAGIPAAASFVPGELPVRPTLPAFVKPRCGRGSIGAFAARTTDELDFFCRYVADPVVQDYLDGPEYTIDMLCDFDGRPLSVVPRERVVVRAGVIDRGRTVNDPALIRLGVHCAALLPFAGAVNVQCRTVAGVPTVFEINARFSGGIALTVAAGADFPGMLVDLALGRTVAPAIGGFTGDLWMTNWESSRFLRAGALDVLRAPGEADGIPAERVA